MVGLGATPAAGVWYPRYRFSSGTGINEDVVPTCEAALGILQQLVLRYEAAGYM